MDAYFFQVYTFKIMLSTSARPQITQEKAEVDLA